MKTYWNGLPTLAERGTAIVADAPEFPNYWARTEGIVGERIPVVRVVLDGVNAGGGVDHLDNREGGGWLKVTAYRGSPAVGFRSVRIEPGSFVAEPFRFEGESDPIATNPILRGVDLAMERLVRRDCFTESTLTVLDELRAEVLAAESGGLR